MITLKSTTPLLVALLTLGVFSTQAQEQTVETNSLKPGAWAIQFAIGQNFTLSSFQGATISMKYHISTTNAMRVGISVFGNTGSSTSLTTPAQADTLGSSNSMNNSSNSQTIELRAQYIWYLNPEGITHFFTGLGPIVSFRHGRDEREAINTYNSGSSNTWSKQTQTQISNSWSIGASALAGVEYFPTRLFSLHAEYDLYLTYQHEKSEFTSKFLNSSGSYSSSTNNSTGIDNQWTLGGGGVTFGLSIYF